MQRRARYSPCAFLLPFLVEKLPENVSTGLSVLDMMLFKASPCLFRDKLREDVSVLASLQDGPSSPHLLVLTSWCGGQS